MRGERYFVGLILLTLGGALAFRANQPIVENYVGRQIPTAMVARNLDLGSGFLHPTLDTAPISSQFLVEPPLYAQMVVGVKHVVGFVWEDMGGAWLPSVWEVSGRLTSALMTMVGAWSLHGLVRRREGPVVALVALGSFCLLPVVLRYGRAFQPDATMLGFVLLGLRGWDAFEAGGRAKYAIGGGLALTVGLTLKITMGWVLIPYLLLVQRLRLGARIGVGVVMLIPAVAWYVYAGQALGESRTSAANAAVWVGALAPANWVHLATWEAIARNLVVRAFTPIGFGLAVAGWILVRPSGPGNRLWLGWAVGSGLAIVALAAKWHHGYYWLALAPLAAVGIARALVGLSRFRRLGPVLASLIGVALVGLSGAQAASTWRTPPEWERLTDRWDLLPSIFPNWILIAPEAVIYYADRPGFRLEFDPAAVHRASGEWGESISLDKATADPLALVDFYEQHLGPDLVAGPRIMPHHQAATQAQRVLVLDIGLTTGDPRRTAFRAALRARPGVRVWTDHPTHFAVELAAGGSCSVIRPPRVASAPESAGPAETTPRVPNQP